MHIYKGYIIIGVGILIIVIALIMLGVVSGIFRRKKEKVKNSIYGGER